MWKTDKAATVKFLVALLGVENMLANKSWKTTVGGIVAVLAAVCSIADGLLNGTPINWTASIAAISAGIGLIMARDNSKTSEEVGAKK